MEHVIRAAQPADAEAIASVHVAGWRWAYDGLMPAKLLAGLDVSDRTKQWQQQLGSTDRAVFLVESGEAVMGFASCGPSRDADGHGEVYAIYLQREAQGNGLGAGLWSAALGWLKSQGFETVKVWVLDTNALARDFYERAGLSEDGGRKTSTWAGADLVELSYSGLLT